MNLEYNLLNILSFFGGLQGFALCIYIHQKRHLNSASIRMFIVFLFCLSFLNMMYAFLDWDLFKYYRPLHMFPFPYKWLIAPAFYLYVTYQFKDAGQGSILRKHWPIFLPALASFLIKSYWFAIALSENSYRITQVTVASDFFRIQELFILTFNLVLGIKAFQFAKKKGAHFILGSKNANALGWLRNFILVFVIISAVNLTTYAVDLIIHDGKETWLLIYPSLIINVAYFYWIGYLGFTRPRRMFNNFNGKRRVFTEQVDITKKLQEAIVVAQVYRNSNLTLNELAFRLEITPKVLSHHINEIHAMNFSEFLNFHRIEYVKALLVSKEADKYTLVSLAEKAGFSSKSSFNATFKKMTGKTPSAYKKENNNI